jgi:hypothetical protein
MNSDEIYRLIELMPASGRMYCKVVAQPQQSAAIAARFPLPWHKTRPIAINFSLWDQLPQPQRDLLLLRTVSWLNAIQWFKPDLYQGLVLAGLAGTVLELLQADAAGIVTAGGLTVLAGTQVWRKSRSTEMELEADEKAIQIAQRRGYTETEASHHLLEAIEAAAKLEGRSNPNFTELLRCQNLRAIAGLSPVAVPETLRQE